MEENNREGYDSTRRRVEDTANEFGNTARNAANDFKEDWNRTTHNGENKKLLCGILAIVIGWTGIHKFLLGYNKEGVLQILLSFLCGIGAVIALIEGIIYLTKSDQEFYEIYQIGKRPWF